MKKYIVLLLISASSLFINCNKDKVSAAECEPIVNNLMDKVKAEISAEQMAQFEAMKMTLQPTVQKECMSGKYNLDCLKNAANIAAIQTCKN